MKIILQVLKIVLLFVFLLFEISNGKKRGSYVKIKKIMTDTNLFKKGK
tara:strand:+ start:24 stop:167 length:144 start_codon:yes stop_codon:yes gene_type:complete